MRVVCFGEVLWDCLPKGLFLGGAPFNVGYHLARHGVETRLVSSLGHDFLGDEAFERIAERGLDVAGVHRHPQLATGTVKVRINRAGDATYHIAEPVAWDMIPMDPDVLAGADAIVYGTLAFRGEANRKPFLDAIEGFTGLKVCDVNLRPTFSDFEFARELMRRSDVVKVNGDELVELIRTPLTSKDSDLPTRTGTLASKFGLGQVCVTLGAEGACEWDNGKFTREAGRPVEVRDTVGAGDSFMARYLVGLLRGEDAAVRLAAACRVGEHVAGCDGAQPEYDPAAI